MDRRHFLRVIVGVLLVAASAAGAGPAATERFYLSGADKDHTVAWDFYCDRGRNRERWTTIPVPSNWELRGFGIYNYGRNVGRAERAATATRGAGGGGA